MTNEQQELLASGIFKFYGKPNKITNTRLSIYKGWNSNNTQRARICFFHLVPCPEMGPDKMHIVSYFLKINKNIVRVYTKNCNLDPDLVLDVRETE